MTQGLRTWRGDAQPTSGRTTSWSGRVRGGESPRRVLQPGEDLFQAGEPGCESFIVRTGHLKSYRIHRDGEEQILGMHGPGDVLGFEALIGESATCSVIALEISSIEVVDLPLRDSDTGTRFDGLADIVEGMYRELQRFSRLLYMDRHPADRRLAEFLLDFSRTRQDRDVSRLELLLPLNRRDLARFLGLAPETLSRTFSRFQDLGILSVDNRRIRVTDYPALVEAAGE